MKLPLLLVNFKCYQEAADENALKLAKICEQVARKFNVNLAIAPQAVDIRLVKKVRIPVFAQHIDPIIDGAKTGHTSATAVKKAGAIGTLINHSERSLPLDEIKKCVKIAKDEKLVSVVCSDSLEKTKKLVKFIPDFIAYEPPELISTGISVSKARPEVLSKTVKLVKTIEPKVKVLCGAGISNGDDVKTALKLGTDGVLVASAIVLAKNQRQKLEEMAAALA